MTIVIIIINNKNVFSILKIYTTFYKIIKNRKKKIKKCKIIYTKEFIEHKEKSSIFPDQTRF